MTNSLHPPAALRLRVLHSQGKAPTVCSVFPMKLPGSSFFQWISATLPPASLPRRRLSAVTPPQHRLSAVAPPQRRLSAVAPPRSHGQQLRHSAPASNSAAAPLPATALPRRPRQQQTSFGGEKYSGLASNLAHLGRIC